MEKYDSLVNKTSFTYTMITAIDNKVLAVECKH